MAWRGKKGVNLHIERIPLLREDIDALEILLSQTQEQMLLAVDDKDMDRMMEIAGKWELSCCQVGEVSGEELIRIYQEEKELDKFLVELDKS